MGFTVFGISMRVCAIAKQDLRLQEKRASDNIGAYLIITNTRFFFFFGGGADPYYNYCIMGPPKPILIVKAPILGEPELFRRASYAACG